MNYRNAMTERYFSTHYERFMPKTVKGWEWVLDRIHLNFGDIFSRLPQDSSILDVGCGVGYLELYLLKRGFKNIAAIDLSPEQMSVAKKILAEHDPEYESRVKFYTADVFDFLEKSTSCYDVIAMIDFLDHFTKEEIFKLLRLSHQALREDGFFLLRVTNADNPLFARFFYRDFTHETPFTPESIRQCLNAAGFEMIKIDYERLPSNRNLKQLVRNAILKYALKLFLGIPLEALSEDLVAVGRKCINKENKVLQNEEVKNERVFSKRC